MLKLRFGYSKKFDICLTLFLYIFSLQNISEVISVETDENKILEKIEDKKYGIGIIGYGTGNVLDISPRDLLHSWKKEYKKGKIDEREMLDRLYIVREEYRGLENLGDDACSLKEYNDILAEIVKLERRIRKKERKNLKKLSKKAKVREEIVFPKEYPKEIKEEAQAPPESPTQQTLPME